MSLKTIYKSLLLYLLLLTWTGCKVDEECRIEDTIRLHAVLICDSIISTGDTLRLNALDNLTIQGLGSDSLLLDNASNISSIALPLRNDQNETVFLLTTNNRQETLTIHHQNKQHFISLACGCFVYHTIEDIRSEGVLIDSIEVLNSNIENYTQDNIRIHLLLKN